MQPLKWRVFERKHVSMLTMISEIILPARKSLKTYAKDSEWDIHRNVVYNWKV